MACKASYSFFAFLLISSIMLATTWQAIARHNIFPKNSNTQDRKEPQTFKFDGGFYNPGFGNLGFPPLFGNTPQNPFTGSGGGEGDRSYVPGGDSTFAPNPGFETPIPGSGAVVPAAVPVAAVPAAVPVAAIHP